MTKVDMGDEPISANDIPDGNGFIVTIESGVTLMTPVQTNYQNNSWEIKVKIPDEPKPRAYRMNRTSIEELRKAWGKDDVNYVGKKIRIWKVPTKIGTSGFAIYCEPAVKE